ncbi:MAG: c-type cytochrome [Nitrospirae bacterium]|nr:c-type cytochrome [Nitrospirota bacterium]
MSEHGNYDNIKEANKGIPVGYVVFFAGTIVWLIWYIVSYTPQISGWSQYKVFDKEMKEAQLTEAKAVKENPYKDNGQAIGEGKALFTANCAACHGENLKGGVGPDLLAEKTIYGDSDSQFYESVAKGRANGMPPFDRQLGPDRIWKVVSFIKSLRSHK